MANTTKKTLIALALVFTVINGGLVLAANEQYSKLHSAFGTEDPDPDLDGVYMNEDKCPGSSFDLWLLNKDSKKQKGSIEFADVKDAGKTVYVRLKNVTKAAKGGNEVAVEASSDAKFSKGLTKQYILSGNKVTTVDMIARRFRALYSNATNGIAVVWSMDLESKNKKAKGCTVNEESGLTQP
ncbi:hypothetical protein HZA42_04695 [Candidatus Peregrinibacteria bacterium]|nr:hypothetical protein [Candidatus Peregrinibacteria bacterium]